MIGPVVIPASYEQWNRKWHAPHGRPLPAPLGRVPDLRGWQVRYQGPFAFQPNNATRRFEYPWAFYSVRLGPGMSVVDLGGGLSGFQFTLAGSGAAVTNVDPFSDYGSMVGYETIDPGQAIGRLNRIYRTDVRLMRCDLEAAALPTASVDVVYCISTLEHLGPEERASALYEIGRILRVGGHLVLTVDLFLDLMPFTDRVANRYGTNVDLAEVVKLSGLTLVGGRPEELYGFSQFDARRIQENLSEYLVGAYPAMAQCLVLQQDDGGVAAGFPGGAPAYHRAMATLHPAGNGATSLARPGPGSPPEALYLDLLKRCLTRFDLDEDLGPVVPGDIWKRRAWAVLAKLLGRRGIVTYRHIPFEPWVREEGLDWPVRAETMIGLRRLDNLQYCVEEALASGVEGDLLEAGVWRGGATIFMRGVLAAHGDSDRTVWVADSFEGLPKPRDIHPADSEDLHWTQPYLAVSMDDVKRNFTRYGLLDGQVRFLPGWFSDTLAGAPIERLAVLRVDCDMYGSTTDVLSALYPKVSPGGFVIIDDYGDIASCKAAVDDYRAEHAITEPLVRIDKNGVFWRHQG